MGERCRKIPQRREERKSTWRTGKICRGAWEFLARGRRYSFEPDDIADTWLLPDPTSDSFTWFRPILAIGLEQECGCHRWVTTHCDRVSWSQTTYLTLWLGANFLSDPSVKWVQKLIPTSHDFGDLKSRWCLLCLAQGLGHIQRAQYMSG